MRNKPACDIHGVSEGMSALLRSKAGKASLREEVTLEQRLEGGEGRH